MIAKNLKGHKALVLGVVSVELGYETPVDRPKPAAYLAQPDTLKKKDNLKSFKRPG